MAAAALAAAAVVAAGHHSSSWAVNVSWRTWHYAGLPGHPQRPLVQLYLVEIRFRKMYKL